MKNYISVSLISGALTVMKAMKKHDICCKNDIEAMHLVYGINKDTSLEMAVQCGWIIENHNDYQFTELGNMLMDQFDEKQISTGLYRTILKHYIDICKPIWAKRIPYGRKEAYRIMSEEEQACFNKAGLMKKQLSMDIVDWWDKAAQRERQNTAKRREAIGREGEKCTIRYERERTGVEPIWQAIESNLAGYDIISREAPKSEKEILIEVKSSVKNIRHAEMILSREEWDFASQPINQPRYFVYLWCFDGEKKLAIISFYDLLPHIPKDSGMSQWNSVTIPFRLFESAFNPIV